MRAIGLDADDADLRSMVPMGLKLAAVYGTEGLTILLANPVIWPISSAKIYGVGLAGADAMVNGFLAPLQTLSHHLGGEQV